MMLFVLALLFSEPPAIADAVALAMAPKPPLTARAVVVEVTDADTVVLDATIWHDLTHRVRLRIKGLDAPELNTAAGKKAHAWAKANLPVGSAVTIISGGYDKYGGRDLGDIKYDSGDLYSNAIVKFGHAKKWDGKGPKPQSPFLPQTTPVGPGITIAPVTTPAPGGGLIGIKFRDTLAGAKAEAAGVGRPVAVVVTGEACPPCRRMEAETYNAAPVVEALNGEFLPVKLVAEQATLEVAALGVNQWPTTVILDGKTGRELRRVTGYCGPVEYLAAIRGDPAPRGGRRPVQNLAKAAGWLLRGKE